MLVLPAGGGWLRPCPCDTLAVSGTLRALSSLSTIAAGLVAWFLVRRELGVPSRDRARKPSEGPGYRRFLRLLRVVVGVAAAAATALFIIDTAATLVDPKGNAPSEALQFGPYAIGWWVSSALLPLLSLAVALWAFRFRWRVRRRDKVSKGLSRR